ncbi:MAG: glycosyltransferase family 4 protein, partial [Ignavibacteriales bacterium]|nr:glycosyltransferase family 4 protein [Ignavibacteriales bacterium]
LPDIYRKADVFILPSLREPWGHVVTEAAASGLPLIVSNKVGSSPDLVKHDVNGYIYEPNNIRKLAKYIMKLVYSSKLRKKMGKESEKIASNYNYDRMVKMFLDNLEL